LFEKGDDTMDTVLAATASLLSLSCSYLYFRSSLGFTNPFVHIFLLILSSLFFFGFIIEVISTIYLNISSLRKNLK